MKQVKRFRNRDCMPHLESEGILLNAPKEPPEFKKRQMYNVCAVCGEDGLKPFERLHAHQTLAGVRRNALFKPYEGLIPRDELDLILGSSYNHSTENFPNINDVYLQAETLGKDTWRRLQNTRDIVPEIEKRDYLHELLTGQINSNHFPYQYNFAHPVLISGITEKKHPSSVKLMNSSHHLPQTNAGYSRQDSDGNCYQY